MFKEKDNLDHFDAAMKEIDEIEIVSKFLVRFGRKCNLVSSTSQLACDVPPKNRMAYHFEVSHVLRWFMTCGENFLCQFEKIGMTRTHS